MVSLFHEQISSSSALKKMKKKANIGTVDMTCVIRPSQVCLSFVFRSKHYLLDQQKGITECGVFALSYIGRALGIPDHDITMVSVAGVFVLP
jgi:hypothetical protein